MKRFKNLFLIPALLCAAPNVQADGYRSVEVRGLDGSVTSISLTDNLKTEFKKNKVIFSDGDLLFEFYKSKVSTFTFSESVGVDNIAADGVQPVVEPGRMSITGLPEHSRVRVFTIGGKVVSDVWVSGDYILDINGLAKGVYLVNVNGMSYKVMVK